MALDGYSQFLTFIFYRLRNHCISRFIVNLDAMLQVTYQHIFQTEGSVCIPVYIYMCSCLER